MSSELSTDKPTWAPPSKIEDLYAATAGNNFSAINSPVAGARETRKLPEGTAPIQLYSLATPNGIKVSILLEELGIEYDAHVINIGKGDQFTSGFVDVNPNSKIPALMDKDGPDGNPLNLFESGSIALYLAEKYHQFIPLDPRLRAEVMNWVFWQMAGQGPMTGNFGHFMVYAPADQVGARDYGAARYGMEVSRLCSVLDKHLDGRTYMVGEEYTLADIMCYPWIRQLFTGYKHPSGIDANSFLTASQYKNIAAWAQRIGDRPAVQRGVQVCSNGQGKPWLVTADQS
jgi:GST-like protein